MRTSRPTSARLSSRSTEPSESSRSSTSNRKMPRHDILWRLEKQIVHCVNRDKSCGARPWTRRFVGYCVTWDRAARLRVAPAAVQRLKTKLRCVLRQGRGRRLAVVVTDLNLATRGWVVYFGWQKRRRVSRTWRGGVAGHCAASCAQKTKGHRVIAMPPCSTGLAPPAFTAPCRNQTSDCIPLQGKRCALTIH
jgi:hypothetical protein